MAELGLRYSKYNLIDESTGKYKAFASGQTVPKSIGKLMSASLTKTNDTAEIYGDDALAEQFYGFVEGELNLEFVNVADDTVAELFGHDITSNELTAKGDDSAPACGYGHVVSKMVGGSLVYKAEFLPKVKFENIQINHQTKGKNVNFVGASLKAKVMQLAEAMNSYAAGTYYKCETFETLSAAEAQVDSWLTPST